MALEWIASDRARKRGDQTLVAAFMKTRLGKNYTKAFAVHNKSQNLQNAGDYELAKLDEPFDLKTWWPDAQFAIGSVDVGKDHYWAVFRAWSLMRGRIYSRLMWAGLVHSVDRLREMQNHFSIPDYGGATNIGYDRKSGMLVLRKPCGMFIDGNYDRVLNVRRAAADYSWMVYRGRDNKNRPFDKDFVHQDKSKKIYSNIEAIEHWEGGGDQKRIPTVQRYFASRRCIDILFDMRNVRDDEANYVWTFPKNVCTDYLKHLDSFSRSDDGELIQHHQNDHLLDCEKMQIGAIATRRLIGENDL